MTTQFSLDGTLAMLRRTPDTLATLLNDLPEPWNSSSNGELGWSLHEIITHLIAGERANWLPRAKHLLAGETTPFEPFDREADFDHAHDQTPSVLLATFKTLRSANIAAVAELNLTASDLAKTGQHPEFGSVTLAQLLATWLVHDLDHTAQIVRLLAHVYADAVGPWRAYLAILGQHD